MRKEIHCIREKREFHVEASLVLTRYISFKRISIQSLTFTSSFDRLKCLRKSLLDGRSNNIHTTQMLFPLSNVNMKISNFLAASLFSACIAKDVPIRMEMRRINTMMDVMNIIRIQDGAGHNSMILILLQIEMGTIPTTSSSLIKNELFRPSFNDNGDAFEEEPVDSKEGDVKEEEAGGETPFKL